MVQPPVGFLQLLENKTNLPRITLAKSNELLECSPSRHRQRWIAVPTRHTVGRGSCFVTRIFITTPFSCLPTTTRSEGQNV